MTANVGVCGLGKLGLILALVLDVRGDHIVTGYDPSPRAGDLLAGRSDLPGEAGFEALRDATTMDLTGSPAGLVETSDVIFVVVPTPHANPYGGHVPAPAERKDFEYGFLVQAVRDLCRAANDQTKPITIVIVSTVLPGTINREIRPLLNDMTTLVYSPSLIALGTIEEDLLAPEFVIVGADNEEDVYPVQEIYSSLHNRPIAVMDIVSAELTKIAYNTFTSLKIVFGNTMLELAEKTGADCDSVYRALALGTDKLLTHRYLRGGVAGGGFCHPRDVIAMSWLAERVGLSSDIFGFLAKAREDQSSWLAESAIDLSTLTGLPIVILGKAYKPQSDLTGGSPGLLLLAQLAAQDVHAEIYDPYVDTKAERTNVAVENPRVFVIMTAHSYFRDLPYAPGSVVIDPHGYVNAPAGVTLVRPGRKH
jgi:UDPglucose 6-dehydrogenase